MSIRKATRTVLGAAIAVLFLWLLARQVKVGDVSRVLATSKTGWIFIATFLFVVGYACRIERWRVMLSQENPGERWASCAGPFLASFAANNVLPLRAGDVLRVFAFNRRLGAGPGAIAATLLVERLLDLLMVLMIFGVVLVLFDLHISTYAGLSGAGLIGLTLAVILMLLFLHRLEPVLRFFGRSIARLWPRVENKTLNEVEKSLETLKTLARGHVMLRLVSLSVVAWTFEAVVYYLSALALPGLVAPLGGYLALPLTAFATLIPSAPGYLGTFDFFAVRAMTGLGNSEATSAAYAVLIHLIVWLPITLIGGLCWVRSSEGH